VHAAVTLPPGVRVVRAGGIASSVALSPDGRTLVVAATDEDGQRLYVRPFDRPEAVPLAGTENGVGPFFSPDGAWIGFFADGRLRRVPAGGGAAVDIAVAPGLPLGGSWGDNDRIVFSAGTRSALHVVPARGGDPAPLTTLDADAGEVSHRHPELLPDGRTLLFTSLSPAGWSVNAFDLRSGRRVGLTEGATPRYVTGGYVALNRGTDLLAAPFDPTSLEITGAIVPMVQSVAAEMASTMHYAVSRNGTLAYVPAAADPALVIIRDGEERIVDVGPGAVARPPRPRFSPDGTRLALTAGRTADVWIHDLRTGGAARLTFDGGSDPVWTPDGNAVTFAASPFLGTGPGRRGLHTQPSDGRSGAERLLALEEWHRPIGWTPDGRMLAFETVRVGGPPSIWVFEDGEARRVLREGYSGRLSPDGRWLAYHSEAAGSAEVYVTPFPEADARWQISAAGGSGPAWSSDGIEVYYRSADRLMAAGIETDAGVRVTSRRVVLEPFAPWWPDDYDVHPDGRSLALVRPADAPRDGEVGIVVNWAAELGRLGW
jgi:eukaryotic-like serine/threonine-protein kinase